MLLHDGLEDQIFPDFTSHCLYRIMADVKSGDDNIRIVRDLDVGFQVGQVH